MGDCSDRVLSPPSSPCFTWQRFTEPALFPHAVATFCDQLRSKVSTGGLGCGGMSASLAQLGALVLPALVEIGYALKEEGAGRLLGHILARLSECKASARHGPWASVWASAPL